MSDIEPIIKRMKEACRLRTDTDLANYLGLTGSNIISTWKKRGSKPFSYCEVISKREGVTMDWLLTGEGIKRKDHVMSIPDARTLKTIEMIKQLPEDGQREILSRIEKMYAADLQSKKIDELTELVELLRKERQA